MMFSSHYEILGDEVDKNTGKYCGHGRKINSKSRIKHKTTKTIKGDNCRISKEDI